MTSLSLKKFSAQGLYSSLATQLSWKLGFLALRVPLEFRKVLY
jgi:hypothetical protein